MSERERWIIYPLLFFALGAALRDKFTHEVRTDRLMAGQVVCEELLVTDSEKPDRVVAKLTSNPPQRNRPNADVEEGHRSTTFAHLANIALATRARLDWDATAERFTNHEPANALLDYEYRKPWTHA